MNDRKAGDILMDRLQDYHELQGHEGHIQTCPAIECREAWAAYEVHYPSGRTRIGRPGDKVRA